MYSLNNLRRRSSRSILTVLGLALAIALTVTMFSVGEGIRGSTKAILEQTGVDIFVLSKNSNPLLYTMPIEHSRNISKSLVEGAPDNLIRAAYPMLTYDLAFANETQYQAAFGDGNLRWKVANAIVNGIQPEMEQIFGGVTLIEGYGKGKPGCMKGMPTPGDPFYANGTYDGGKNSKNFTHEMVINEALADRLNVKVGDKVYVSPVAPTENGDKLRDWFNNSFNFTITGIVEVGWAETSSRYAFIHLSEFQFIMNKLNDSADQILIDLRDPSQAERVKKWIESNYDLSAVTQSELLGEIEEFTGILETAANMIALITTFVALMFTATVMALSIGERTSEIGALRAIGFSRVSIVKLILAESCVLAFIAFVVGLGLGLLASNGIENFLQDYVGDDVPPNFHFTLITPYTIIRVSAIALVVGVFAGILPAWRASNVNIARVLRSE
ncbi:MAG: FtsX-like permease family protein [Thermoplasmata archaeon]